MIINASVIEWILIFVILQLFTNYSKFYTYIINMDHTNDDK